MNISATTGINQPEDATSAALRCSGGRVCGPDGTTWLVGATVSVDVPGQQPITTTTDGEGRYTLSNVPAGSETIQITKGSFSTTKTVDVHAGGTATIPDDQCAGAPSRPTRWSRCSPR